MSCPTWALLFFDSALLSGQRIRNGQESVSIIISVVYGLQNNSAPYSSFFHHNYLLVIGSSHPECNGLSEQQATEALLDIYHISGNGNL